MTQIQISFGPSSLPALMGLTSSRSFKECGASYVVVNWWHILCRQSRADPKNEKKDRHKELIDRDSSSAGKKSVPFLSKFSRKSQMFQHILLLMPKKMALMPSFTLIFVFVFTVEERIITRFFKNVHIPISFFKGKFCFFKLIDFWREEQVNNLLKKNHKKYEWLFFTNYQSIAKTSLSN